MLLAPLPAADVAASSPSPVLPSVQPPPPAPGPTAGLSAVLSAVVPADVDAALALAAGLDDVPVPGAGRTLERWDLLAELAAADLTTARVVEAHLDALAILAEAGLDDLLPSTGPGNRTWGVFAAEGPGVALLAEPGDGGWTLTGRKPWCSLAARLDAALVTARTPTGRRLFAVRLDGPGVRAVPGTWVARGLVGVDSGPVDFVSAPATPVGADAWYLERPGFAHGGIGVAACWFGAALALARSVADAAARREPDQLALWHLGALDLAVVGARQALREAAVEVDAGRAAGPAGEVLALRVRSAVASAAEAVVERVGHALGPAPLTTDAAHAARVADLTVYVRQHHAERDVARLGRLLLDAGARPW